MSVVINSIVKKATRKYGTQVPCNLQHAREIDRSNGNKLWADYIKTEIFNLSVAFEILNED